MNISTGSKDLNYFLKGYPKLINLIYGEPSTGKTTLALQATIAQAKNNKKVIYVDTEGGFSIERLKQLHSRYNKFLDQILILRPKSFQEQEKYILNLPDKVSLIIVDTISYFYRDELKEDSYNVNKSLDLQLQKLLELSKKGIPIILTSQVYKNLENKIIPCGNNLVKRFCKNIIKLQKEPRKIIHETQNKELLIEIKEKGIFKKREDI